MGQGWAMALGSGNASMAVPEAGRGGWRGLGGASGGGWAGEMDGAGVEGAGLGAEAEARMAQGGADMARLDSYGK